MSNPRFRVGQVVVLHGLTVWNEYNGQMSTITDRRVANFEYSPNIGRYQGWVYRLDHFSKWVPEQFLRPYDPPASWDDEDMIWRPSGRKTETTNQEPEETI